jgi:fumarate hydratase subunit beta
VSTTHHFETPLSEAAVRKLATGDMVYLHGEVVLAAGLPTHERIIEHLDSATTLPIDLAGAVMLHFGSYSREVDDRFEVLYMNPTTSTRFNPYMPRLVKTLGLRAVGGKGGLDSHSARAMQEQGCVYLSFPGGGCTLYSNAIREVAAVAWRDLIYHYRLVKLRVEGLGPGTVGIDAHGNSLYDGLQAQAASRLPQILAELAASRAASSTGDRGGGSED